MPSEENHDFEFNLPDIHAGQGKEWNLFVEAEYISGKLVYAAIKIILPEGGRRKRAVGDDGPETNGTDLIGKVMLTRCRAWDSLVEKWTYDSCSVDNSSDFSTTQCHCNKLTSYIKNFAGGVSVPGVNPINFKDIFGNFADKLASSPTVFGTMLSITALYVILAVRARRADKKDVEKWEVAPLLDNKQRHHHYYKVSVSTGLRQNSGTRSNLFFIMSGDNGDTGTRKLEDGTGKFFTRGSVRHFLMTTGQALGSLTFMRIWHVNAGKGEKASWFLDKVEVEDLKNKKRYFFLCGRWLAADEEDGQVERVFPVAGEEEVTGFKHLFFTKARHKLTDDHIWISVLSRPTKSSFTRLQRLTCCLTLLYTTMVANAMFFRGSAPSDSTSGSTEMDEGTSDQSIKIGPLVLSVQALLVSIFGSLVAIPVNIVLVMFFRKVRPRGWIDTSDPRAVQKAAAKSNQASPEVDLTDIAEDLSDDESEYEYVEEEVEVEEIKQKKKRWWKKKYPLPSCFLVVAWVIAFLACLTSAFFVVMYSLEWGKARSEEWMSSLLLSFFQSVIIVQPVKVVFLAMIMSAIFRKLDESDEEEKKEIEKKAKDQKEDPLAAFESLAADTTYKPPSQRALEKARHVRDFEKRMWALIREVTFYFLFLVLISFIAWGAKDDTVYKLNKHVHDLFNGDDARYKYTTVKDGHKFWQWMKQGAIPAMYMDLKYNGVPTLRRDRAYMADWASYRVGAPRLRQLRVVPASCNVVDSVSNMMIECNEPYQLLSEENRNFTVGWYLGHENVTDLDRLQLSYKYNSMFKLRGMPYWGMHATYGGGGYVAELGVSSYDAGTLVDALFNSSWIDLYTRAVVLEFTIYNPAQNLFAYVNYLMEFPPTGGVFPFPRVMTFSIYSGLGGMGGMLVFCQIMYVLIVIAFIYKEAKKIKATHKQYFNEPWNVLELSLIITSVVAIAMFGMKLTFGKIVMNQLKENKDGYTNYMALATYDEAYSYVIGIIIFFANVKFLRLLRFNRHICELAATLKMARKDICYFGVTFLLVFTAFSTFGYLVFGKQMYSFATYTWTFEALYSMLIGKFEFKNMSIADTLFGRAFFVVFCVVVFFILVNMFLGILSTNYMLVRMNPHLLEQDYEVVAFLISKFKKFFGLTKKTTKRDDASDYVDPMDSLDMRINSIDRFVNEIYRHMLQGNGYPTPKGAVESQKPTPAPAKLGFLAKFHKKSNEGATLPPENPPEYVE